MKLKRAVILVLALLFAIVSLGCSKETAVKNTPESVAVAFIKSYLADDYVEMDKLSAITQSDMMQDEIARYAEESGYTEDEYWQEIAEYYELEKSPTDYKEFAKLIKDDRKAVLTEALGENYKISAEVSEVQRQTQENLAIFLEELELYEFEYSYFEVTDIEDACAVTVEARIDAGDGENDMTGTYELLVVKLGGRWKILYVG